MNKKKKYGLIGFILASIISIVAIFNPQVKDVLEEMNKDIEQINIDKEDIV